MARPTSTMFLAAVLALLPVAAAAQCLTEDRPEGTWTAHPDGFGLLDNGDFGIACREGLMAIADPAQPERTSGEARVQVVADEPPGPWPDIRRLDGDVEAHYRVEELEGGGSGGTPYQITAWRAFGGGYLVVEQLRQFELFFGGPGLDEWSLVWTLLKRVEPAR